jgi:DNA invertase Pin-like site-specific DNA recombinase
MPTNYLVMTIGYACEGPSARDLSLQLGALMEYGCDEIIRENQPEEGRIELARVLVRLRRGDRIVVWHLGCLGDSCAQLVRLLSGLRSREIAVSGIADEFDSACPESPVLFRFVRSLLDFDRTDRLRSTLSEPPAGRTGGGRPKGFPKEVIDKIRKIQLLNRLHRPEEIIRMLGLSRATYYRYLKIGEQYAEEDLHLLGRPTIPARREKSNSVG